MLSLDDADGLLTGTAIRTPAIRVAQDGDVLGETAYVRGARRSPAARCPVGRPPQGARPLRRWRDHRLQGLHLPPAADRPGRPVGARARSSLSGQRLPHAAGLARASAGAQRQPRRVRLPDPRHQQWKVHHPRGERRCDHGDHGDHGDHAEDCRVDDVLLLRPGSPCTCRPDAARRPRAGRRQPARDDRHQPAHVARSGAAHRRPAPRRGRRAAPARRLGRYGDGRLAPGLVDRLLALALALADVDTRRASTSRPRAS